MIIGIDANALTRPFQHGIRRYLEDLIKGISKIDNKNTYIFFSSKKINIPKKKNFKFVIIPKFPIFKRQFFLPLAVIREKVDIFHNIDPFGPITLRRPIIITTVHDIKLESIYPRFRSLKYFTKYIYTWILRFFTFKNTHHFISVSKSVTKELKRYVEQLNLVASVETIYEAPSEKFRRYSMNSVDKKYFLCMADFSPRKNFENVLKSFSEFQVWAPTKYKLRVIVSTHEESIRISKIVQGANLEKSVKIYISPTDETVFTLYRFATAFIYISLYEGFGLPILEAMSVGCPVITSNIGATKEIAGSAAILVNPRSVQFIAKAMLEFTKGKALRNTMIKKGLKRSSEFSVMEMAKKTVKTYQTAYNTKNEI